MPLARTRRAADRSAPRTTRTWTLAALLAAAHLILAPLPALAAEPRQSTPHTTPAHVIPFQTMSSWVIVPVRVNGSRELRCILDTGMPEGMFVFDPRVGEEANLDYVASTPVKGVGPGTQTANVAMGLTFDCEGLIFEGQNAYVLSTHTDLATFGVDGAIGATIFNRYIVRIDFDAATLSLFDPDNYDPGDANAIPLTLSATKPYVRATVGIEDREPVEATLLLDTGDTGSIELFSDTLDGLSPPAKSHELVVAAGVGGEVEGHVGRATSVTLAGHTLDDVVASFSQGARAANGSIGIQLLRRFVPTIDYPHARLYLTPAPNFHDPFEFDMAGLVLRPRAGGALAVHSVLADSPAERADIQPGDVITAIDELHLDDPDDSAARERLRQPGKTVTLTIDRDGEPIKVTLTLERLI